MTDDNHESTEAPTIGTLVVDEARMRMGVVMDDVAGRLQIRPPSGGREWDADPTHVRSVREDEIARVRATTANATAIDTGAAAAQGRSL
ncbi:hypothetical protein [Streptomyces sp. PA5.6]|uniref:hypothetical protein n=1 Tax=Streptomyces sp. PA5.6 TaxID=3035651 RepID=UPI003904B0ED